MTDVFISYAREDRPKIEKLSLALESLGYEVWWDRQLVGGSDFTDIIQQKLEEARSVVVVWSTSSRTSRWVRDEAAEAAESHKLVPISLDGGQAPLGFRQFHSFDFGLWNETAEDDVFRSLASSINTLLENPPAAAQSAAASPTQMTPTAMAPTQVTPPPADDATVIVREPLGPGELSPGAVISSTFKIEKLLGRGGMGQVYLARHTFQETLHALKRISPELADDPKCMALFRREAELLRRISSEAVVGYDGVIVHDGGATRSAFLAMEFAEGPSLKEYVQQHGAIDVEQFKALLGRVAEGLQAAHEKGVFHRDMSPDNIILCGGESAQAKIIDFGIAREENKSDATILGGAFAGKVTYAAPEQFGLFNGDIDARTDIYSVGLCMAYGLLGRPIFENRDIFAARDERVNPPDLSEAPMAARAVLEKMLAPDPADRFQSMAEAQAALADEKTMFGGLMDDLTQPPGDGDDTLMAPPPSTEPSGAPQAAGADEGGSAIDDLLADPPTPTPTPTPTLDDAPTPERRASPKPSKPAKPASKGPSIVPIAFGGGAVALAAVVALVLQPWGADPSTPTDNNASASAPSSTPDNAPPARPVATDGFDIADLLSAAAAYKASHPFDLILVRAGASAAAGVDVDHISLIGDYSSDTQGRIAEALSRNIGGDVAVRVNRLEIVDPEVLRIAEIYQRQFGTPQPRSMFTIEPNYVSGGGGQVVAGRFADLQSVSVSLAGGQPFVQIDVMRPDGHGLMRWWDNELTNVEMLYRAGDPPQIYDGVVPRGARGWSARAGTIVAPKASAEFWRVAVNNETEWRGLGDGVEVGFIAAYATDQTFPCANGGLRDNALAISDPKAEASRGETVYPERTFEDCLANGEGAYQFLPIVALSGAALERYVTPQ